ncbi:hypothetical protein, partial [Vibrio sp.]|uniref:hypothetical protein n=1 Tax=Vibrio sp. TaxID=678 RepID=UPI003F6B2E9E
MSSLAIKKNIYISKPLKLVVFFILFLSSMRFILPNIYNLACAGFLLLYFHFFFSNRRLANTFGVMVIFTLVDNGGAAYGETPSLLRYLCYFSVLAPYFMCKLSYKRVVITLTIFSFYFFMTLLNLNSFDTGVFGRDLFIFFLFLVVFGTTFSKDFTIDVRVLAYLIFAFGLFEICNSFLYDPSSDYLSYDSTKALICFFSMYSIVQKKINIVQTTLLILLTVVILSLYVTRMIFVSYLFVVFLLLIRNRLNVYMLFSLVPLVFIFNYFLLGFDFEKIKLIYTLNRMLESGLEFNNFVYLDPVRFYELM